jgi:polyribonucleotide nucleotidyltransferase
MDFKVTGTKEGITALQMDIKIKELSPEIMTKALDQAKVGRLHILDEMMKAIDTHRTEISPFAPKVYAITINKDKIRDIIGPGGKTIRAIQADTNTRLEVDDSGIVKITAENQTDCDAAIAMVKDIGTDPEVGTVFEGTVSKITDFGAFVNVKNGVDGLVHISELANYRVKKVTDIVKEGETLKVKILEVTRDGKIRLSHKATLEEKE